MYRKVLVGILLASAIATQAFAAPKCTDISTVWTLNSTFVDDATGTRIYTDGSTYVDGGRNVSASIKCATDDAVLMVNSPRKVMFNFIGSFLGQTGFQPPSWTANGPLSTPADANCKGSPCNVVNIRNILNSGNAPRNTYYILYTKLEASFVAPDLQQYYLRMENPATSDVAPTPNNAGANSPYLNARVVVEHYPASGNQKEYWLVYPETPTSMNSQSPSPENAVLLGDGATVNDGQFSIPFYFMIQAQ